MSYSVSDLAKISGVSVRTLHWYDEIGLLKPLYRSDGGYRYYEEQELLRLQQILFFKELGFALSEIQKLLLQDSFDQIESLRSHKESLTKEIQKKRKLIKTIDKTIDYLQGNRKQMMLEEIFEGFTEQKQQHYVEYLVEKGVDRTVLEQWHENTKNWTEDDWLKHKDAMDVLHQDLVEAITAGVHPTSNEVQKMIAVHYQLVSCFWVPDKQSYPALAELYASHEDFVSFYHNMYPDLLVFLQEAMNHYAEESLS